MVEIESTLKEAEELLASFLAEEESYDDLAIEFFEDEENKENLLLQQFYKNIEKVREFSAKSMGASVQPPQQQRSRTVCIASGFTSREFGLGLGLVRQRIRFFICPGA